MDFVRKNALVIAVAVMAVILLGWWATAARAADKAGPDFLDPLPKSTASNPWTGCWAGAGLGIANTVLSGGGPAGLSVDGQQASGHLGCRVQAGAFVGGLEGSYGWVFGDLNTTLGVNHQMAVTGTLGALVLPRAQVYGHVTWARVDSVIGDIDGWKFGPGVAIQIPNSPMEIDLRYSYGTWDVPFGIDVNSHEVMAIAKYRFGAK